VGGYIYGQQDDGTSYYGRCIGSQLRFDVYSNGRFVGRQTGSVSGSYAAYSPSADGSTVSPYYAAPPPGGGGSQRATFSWRSIWGSGYENWRR
jgi:hypothetical protein